MTRTTYTEMDRRHSDVVWSRRPKTRLMAVDRDNWKRVMAIAPMVLADHGSEGEGGK